jgi:hypothetical protein
MLMTIEEWLAKYVSPSGHLTQKGRMKTTKFPRDTFHVYVIHAVDRYAFLTHRAVMQRSYAASAVIRHMFSGPYGRIDRTIACARAAEVPLIHTDFDGAAFFDDPEWSPIRLSPVIMHAMGATGIGEFFLSMAAVAHAFTQNLETVRSFLELIVTDNATERLAWEADELTKLRSKIEDRFIRMAPPSHKSATVDECLEWYNQFNLLLEKAQNPEIQPVDTIPWY